VDVADGSGVKFLRPLSFLLLFASTSVFGGIIVRDCYGCAFSTDIEKVSRMDELGDKLALQKMYTAGNLTVLKHGEKVDVEELSWNPNLRRVRRVGDLAEWYIPMECVSISYSETPETLADRYGVLAPGRRLGAF
jgi:hypothetical protein